MKKLENFYKNLNIILIVVVLSIEGIIIEKFTSWKLEHEWLVVLLGTITLVFIFKFLGFAIEKAIANSEHIRKLILGNDHVEGTWFDVMEFEGVKNYGLYTNSYTEGQILQNGEQLSPEGLTTNTWKTIVSKYENNTLTIIYQVNYFDVKRVEQPYGISMISYSRAARNKAPVSFTGTYYEMTTEFSTNSFRGYKVTDKELLKNLYDPAKRTETLKVLISTFQ